MNLGPRGAGPARLFLGSGREPAGKPLEIGLPTMSLIEQHSLASDSLYYRLDTVLGRSPRSFSPSLQFGVALPFNMSRLVATKTVLIPFLTPTHT